MALIQLPGGWLQNTMTEGGDGDPKKGAELEMESWQRTWAGTGRGGWLPSPWHQQCQP